MSRIRRAGLKKAQAAAKAKRNANRRAAASAERRRAAASSERRRAAASAVAKNMARKAAMIANKAAVVATRAARVASSMSAASTTRKSPARAMKTLRSLRKSLSPAGSTTAGRRVVRRRRYTMRMARAMYRSPAQTPLRAKRHKHLDKYKRRIFIGPRGGRFALRPRGGRVYHVQENGRRYRLYGVYRKTSSGAIRMLKKFLGVFTGKRRMRKA